MRALLALLSAAAKAAAHLEERSLLIQNGEYEDQLDGVALFPGLIRGDTRYAVLLAGRAKGDLPGGWAGMVHYRSPWVRPGITHRIVDGSWYFSTAKGALRGRAIDGEVRRDDTGRYAKVTLTTEITGGTGSFAGVTGLGALAHGLVDHGAWLPRFNALQSLGLAWPRMSADTPGRTVRLRAG